MVDIPKDAGLADAIRNTAARLGVDPVDLGTAISYETGGRLSPDTFGGGGGKYLGLIQFSPDNQRRYGVKPGMSSPDQMAAVESYLRDRGVKPGHGLLDIYSAINAGRVGRYNASDAAAGGAPGTVADKVSGMAPHRVRAQLLLDGKISGGGNAATARPPAQETVSAAPLSIAPQPVSDDAIAGLIAAAQQIAASAQENELPAALPPMRLGEMRLLQGLPKV